MKYYIYLFLLLLPLRGAAQPDTAKLWQAGAAMQEGHYAGAAALYAGALGQAAPAGLRYKEGMAWLQAGQWEKAKQAFAQTRGHYAQRATLPRAQAAAQLGQYKEAGEYLRRHLLYYGREATEAIKLDTNFRKFAQTAQWDNFWHRREIPIYEAWYEEALIHYKDREYEYALGKLAKYLRQRKEFRAYWLRARVYAAQGDTRNALKDLGEISALADAHPEVFALQARLYAKEGRQRKAREALARARTLAPYDLPILLQWARFALAEGRADAVLAEMGKVKKAIPQHAGVNFLYGKALAASGQYLDALQAYTTCLNQRQDKAEYFVARADAYLATQTYKFAVADYSMALDLAPKQPEVYFKRAQAQLQRGQMRAACYDWKQAARMGHEQAYLNYQRFCNGE